MYWDNDRECTKCKLKFRSQKYEMCYNCRPKKKSEKKEIWIDDCPEINTVLLVNICKKLDIDTKPLMTSFMKTRKERYG